MALRASQGHFSLLFWGGNYGGALITWLEAPFLAVLGFHLWIFWVVDTIVTFLGVLVLRSVASRFLTPVSSAVAAGTFWFFPALWLYWSSREYVFWLPAIVLALTTCLLVLRWFEGGNTATPYMLGLSAGLAIWCYPLVLPLVAPALLIFLWAERHHRGALVRVTGSGFAGLSPWIIYFAVHGRSALHLQTTTGSRLTDLRHSVTIVLPTALVAGQTRAGLIWTTSHPPPRFVGLAVYLAVLVCAVVFIVRRQISLAACAVSVLIWPIVLIVGHVPVSLASFRYGLIVVPPLLLIACHLFSLLRVSLVVAVGALASVLLVTLPDTSSFRTAPVCNTTLSVTAKYLSAEGRTAAWGSYWLASALMVCSQPRITVAAVQPDRDRAAEAAAAAAARSTYIVFDGNELDQEIDAWNRSNRALAQRSVVPGGYVVWMFESRVSPATMKLHGSF